MVILGSTRITELPRSESLIYIFSLPRIIKKGKLLMRYFSFFVFHLVLLFKALAELVVLIFNPELEK